MNRIITNSKSNIFARIRSNHYGESQSFTSVDAAITWVQQASRELVESGYSNVTYTIQGEYNRTECQELTDNSQHSDSICEKTIPKKLTKMEEKKNDLIAEFFSSKESKIKTIAAATMEAAMNSKELSDSEFESAIADASNGMVTLRRSTKNPERVNFLCWDAYTATHSPHNPGHKPLEAIAQAILDTYRRGQSRTAVAIESGANMSNTIINNGLTSGCYNNTTVDELIENIIRTIHTHMLDDVNVKAYLSCHSAGVDAEISAMTGGTINCSISDTKVTLSCGSGVTCSLSIEDKTLNDIHHEIRAILIRYLLHASISPRTRNAIACIVNLESLADMALLEDLRANIDTPIYAYSLL